MASLSSSWNLKGRSAINALDPATRYHIHHSHMMTRCANKPLMWVLEELTEVNAVAGLSGPLKRVEYFACLVARLLQILPEPAIVLTMLRQDIHKYMRVAAMVIVRLIGSSAMQREAMVIGWDDYRKVRVYGDEEEPCGESESVAGVMGGKRSREGTTVTAIAATVGVAGSSEGNNQGFDQPVNVIPAHYFILRMDEVTDRLFGISLSHDNTSGTKSGRGSSEAPRSFFAIPLPPLILKLIDCNIAL